MLKHFYRCCRLIGAFLLAAATLSLGGCQAAPESVAQPSDVLLPFASSQIKPPPSGRNPLPLRAKSSQRLAAQKSYFSLLAKGGAPNKAKMLGPGATPLEAGIKDLRAGPIPHLVLELSSNQRVVLETRALSLGGDTVLHLWSRKEEKQVAFDDDGGDQQGASLLRFTAPPGGGIYLVLLRAYATEDDGLCDLMQDGRVVRRQVTFGGSDLPVAAGRLLQTVLLNDRQGNEPWPPSPRAATDTLLLLVSIADGSLQALDDDSGVEMGSRLTVTGTAGALAVVGAFGRGDGGSARLVVNDTPQGDADGDGLGDGLEQAICTCASAQEKACGFDCATTATPQDTDGDGLSDAEEVLGVDHFQFPQLLVRWGASPRHKDLFVEVDPADWTDTKETPPLKHYGRTPSAEDSHTAARVFAALTNMRNPDGAEGIRLHLDVGHDCGLLPSGIDEVCGNLCAWGPDGKRQCGATGYAGPTVNRRDSLAPGRLHRFHLAVADCLVAGSAPVYSDTLDFDCDRFSAMVHELGHNLGLARHYGTVQTGGGNCKPNYPSLMNYAFSDRFRGTQEMRFSNGSLVGKGNLNSRDLRETIPFGGDNAEVAWLATRPFFYDLYDCKSPGVGCKVDFNRDGRLDASVRAYISPMPNYGWICENVHGNAQNSENLEGLINASGPAAAELPRQQPGGSTTASALHVFAPAREGQGAALHMNHTFARYGKWLGWNKISGPLLRADTQPAAITLTEGSSQRIWVFVTTGGTDSIRFFTVDSAGTVSATQVVPGQPTSLRARDVSVALWQGDLLLVTRDDNPMGGDRVFLTRRSTAGWASSFTPLTAEGFPLRSTVTPAMAAGPDSRLYVVTGDPDPPLFTGPFGRLHLYSFSGTGMPKDLEDEELNGLRFEDGVPDLQHVPWARPAMVFVPHLDGKGAPLSGGRGYLSLWWNRGTRARYLWTWGRLDSTGADFTLGRWHHYEAYGYTDAVAWSGPALALREGARLAAFISQSDLFPGMVRYIPHADGIPDQDIVFRDYDDRPVLRGGLCPSLNWDCPQRCKQLTLPCSKGTTDKALSAPPCRLPRWGEDD